jgi:hypothetical protein
VCLLVREFSKAPEQVGGGLGLRLDAGFYTLDENREEPRVFTPVQLYCARHELGVHDRLGCPSGGQRALGLECHRAGRLEPGVQPEVALGDDAERA